MGETTQIPQTTPPVKPVVVVRRRRRWPWVLLIIFLALIVLVALLPTIASFGFVRRMVLARANQQINGRIEMESWSLGWFSGVKMENVMVLDDKSQKIAHVKTIILPASVPALLGSTKNIGDIKIIEPSADIVIYPDGTNNLSRLAKTTAEEAPSPAPSPEKKGPQAPAPEKKAPPSKFDVRGSIVVKDGMFTLRPAGCAADGSGWRQYGSEN